MALGASAGQVQAMVLRQAAIVGGCGALAGGLLAWAAAGAVGSLLIGVEPFDTVTFAVTAVVLVGTLAVAAWGRPDGPRPRTPPLAEGRVGAVLGLGLGLGSWVLGPGSWGLGPGAWVLGLAR